MKYTNHHPSDLIVRIKNASARNHHSLLLPNVRVNADILNILLIEGYISSFEVKGNHLEVFLKYIDNKSVINRFEVVSKPSKRSYAKKNDIPSYYNGLGVVVLSTSKGIISDNRAIELGVGGEVLCKIF